MNLVDLASPAVGELSHDTPVIIPVAAVEQHGSHLPVFTDSLLLGEVIRRAAEVLASKALFAPLLWLGNSDHHLDFPGTLSAAPRHYLDLLNDLGENFLRHGFRRIIFLNGHGGNEVPGRQAIFELRQRHRHRADLLFLFTTYWALGSHRPEDLDGSFAQREMGHACEWETSMILRIAPHLVGDFRNLNPVAADPSFAPAARGWVTQDRSKAGHIGQPHAASAEKGETLLRLFTNDVVRFIERVIVWDGKSWNG